MIDRDDRIPFWRKVVKAVHEYDCKFILQPSYAGRQQDIGGIENRGTKPLSSTSQTEGFHGLPCTAMTTQQVHEIIQMFADAARRARQAGCDGIETHSGNGYLFTQFLSSAINDRQDEYGGSLENRMRFLEEVLSDIRASVPPDFALGARMGSSCDKSILASEDVNAAILHWLATAVSDIWPLPTAAA